MIGMDGYDASVATQYRLNYCTCGALFWSEEGFPEPHTCPECTQIAKLLAQRDQAVGHIKLLLFSMYYHHFQRREPDKMRKAEEFVSEIEKESE